MPDRIRSAVTGRRFGFAAESAGEPAYSKGDAFLTGTQASRFNPRSFYQTTKVVQTSVCDWLQEIRD
ncbi:MAG TPA: hypothetical protein VE961_15665 [Pyrinomonadaceae bacterium]|nr:hypothetical protein [Pyrinomonadaceae bacterium]